MRPTVNTLRGMAEGEKYIDKKALWSRAREKRDTL